MILMPSCKVVQTESLAARVKRRTQGFLLFFFSFSNIEARAFYSYALQRLPRVVRSGKPAPDTIEGVTNKTDEPWRPFNR